MFCRQCGKIIPAESVFCPECGAATKNNPGIPPRQVQPPSAPVRQPVQQFAPQPVQQYVHQVAVTPTGPKNMATWKVVSGILSIVFSIIMLFQSCAVNAVQNIGRALELESEEEIGGSAGIIVAILMLAVGITSLAGRRTKGSNIGIIVISVIGMFFGFAMAGEYTDLMIWTCWLVVVFVMALIALIRFDRVNGRTV